MRNTSLNHLALCAVIALCMTTPATFAQGKAAKPVAPASPDATTKPGNGDEKVDISDLENKYWAPKDTDFSVVQNRTYSKDHRLFLTPQWGKPINDHYSEGNVFGLTGNYFFSERYGVQLSYLKANLHDNQSLQDLRNGFSSGVAPDHGVLNNTWSVGFNYVPFYAKMSFLGKRIIYFDMAVTPTIGMTTYDQQIASGNQSKSAFTYGIDITQFFFFTNWFAIRADLKNQWYQENIVKYSNTNGQAMGSGAGTQSIQDTMFLLGATFFY